MKRAFLILTLILSLCACSKENRPAKIDISLLYGKWAENYAEYRDILDVDGSLKYTFNEDGTYELHSYDALSGTESTSTYFYTLEKNIITLNSQSPGSEDRRFEIIRLDKYKMELQRVGTTFSTNSLITDYKCFKRIRH